MAGSAAAADRVDPAFDALLADPRVALRPPPPGVAVADLRAAVDRFMARARGPAVASVADLAAPGGAGPVPIRLYRPTPDPVLPLVAFFHGGGFTFGGLDTHDAMCRALAVGSGATVAAVDYRLAPEAAFPAALHDCRDALEWLKRGAGALGLDAGFDGGRVALAGDSAGGQLAAAVALAARDGGAALRHLALIYPLVDPAQSSASARDYAEGHMLTGSFLRWAWQAYAGDGAGDAGARADPSFDLTRADLAGLPPTTIVTAAFDPLRDEGEALGDRLALAGVPVERRRYPGMIHGFAGLPHVTPVAGEALGFVADRLRDALRG